MPNCPKCGSRVNEAMSFCPNCGAALKVPPPRVEVAAPPPQPSPPPPPMRREEKYEKHEKGEKAEKREKEEKGEKHEKQGGSFVGSLVAGVVLIALGILFYLPSIAPTITEQMRNAYILIVIGVVIIVAVIIGVAMASRRNPPT